MPSYEGVDVRTIIAERQNIGGISATFSVEFEKGDSTMSGDAAIEITDESLDLRIYSLGFLIAEVTEADGEIKSNPELGKSRNIILADGLRTSLLWWMIKNYVLEEENEAYHLRIPGRKLIIDKRTMLPRYQSIETDNGRELKIFYEKPEFNGEFWYQSKMRIVLSKYVVNLEIKDISFIPYH